MTNYSYTGRSARGAAVEGTLEANSIDAVANQLLNSGITPIDINETAGKGSGIDLNQILEANKKPSLQDLILFTRQMYTLMKAGVPMVRSISGLIQSTRNYRLVAALKDMLINLESGRDLTSSLSQHPDIFSTILISMVRVGENTGRLEESFLRISGYLEREKETRERIKSALQYPMFVMIAIAIAMAVINIFVIPVFAEMFERANVALPWQTRVLIETSNFFVDWWPAIIGGSVVAILAFRNYINTEKGRYWWDSKKLKFPIVGSILHRATLARFSRAFSMSLTSGVPLIQALTVVSQAVDNEFIAEHILGMRNGIERGESLTRTATVSGIFTPLVLQMLSVGEETGGIDDMMVEVAEFYEREVDYDVKNLSAAIEPILIVVIGMMVLILALGVFLPMWDMSKAI